MHKFTRASNQPPTQTVRHHNQQWLDCQPAKQAHNISPSEESEYPLGLPHATSTHSVASLLTAFTHSVVTLIVLGYGIVTTNQFLIYAAIALAASMNPCFLEALFGLIRASRLLQKTDQSNG